MKIKIFGERNTSTNALKKIIETNSSSTCTPGTMAEIAPVRTRVVANMDRLRFPSLLTEQVIDSVFRGIPDTLSWKHAATNFSDPAAFAGNCVLITVRNPHSWLLSLYKNPYHALQRVPASFAEFLATRWKTVRRERLDGAHFLPLELYETKLLAYRSFREALREAGIACEILRFEDLILHQEAVFERLRPVLENPNDTFVPLAQSTKSRSKNLQYYMDYYGNERWRDKIDADIFARYRLDEGLAEYFGY